MFIITIWFKEKECTLNQVVIIIEFFITMKKMLIIYYLVLKILIGIGV